MSWVASLELGDMIFSDAELTFKKDGVNINVSKRKALFVLSSFPYNGHVSITLLIAGEHICFNMSISQAEQTFKLGRQISEPVASMSIE